LQNILPYLAQNPLFSLAFIFSRIPFWVLIASFSLGYIDGISALIGVAVALFSKGYVEQEISSASPIIRFLSTSVFKPLLALMTILLLVMAYPFLLYFLATEDIYIQTGFIVLLIFTAYILLYARLDRFGLETFGVRGLKRPSGSWPARFTIFFFWLYILFGGDKPIFIVTAFSIIMFLEVYDFTKRYEGIL
jgi:hypothetical protein